MSGILCLKWNNHTSTFIKTLDNLRSKELYCDATIACHGKYFPVHRFVLTTCSEYFEEIFERTQCKHPFIIVKDVEESQLEALLNYMYKGEVNVLQDRLPGLIRAAEALKVKGLAVPEDDTEEKKPVKEKRKSNLSSSPLEPKSKRKSDRNLSERSSHDSRDDDITEILSQSSSRKNPEWKSPRDSSSNSRNRNLVHADPSFQKSSSDKDKLAETEVEDIKIEPSEIFETVDEDFPSNSADSVVLTSRNEESLFVSLLSPNNAHPPSDEELMTGSETSHHVMPQCSSWNDDVNTNSDKVHDEMNAMKVMMTLEEQELRGVCFGVNTYSSSPAAEAFAFCNPPHQCPHCDHRTKTKPELLRHVSYFHSDFRFTCTLCHYKCRTNGLLKKHMLKHTKEKPYTCSLCPYKTARKQHLVRHSKLHTGEKPFSCHICSYKASRKDRLREHLRKHPEISDFHFE